MMPSSSCSGVKLTEDSRLAVSHCTSRRMTCASCFDGLPYGRTATPSPSTRDHSGTLGGRFFGLPASAEPLASAAPVLPAAVRKRRRVGRSGVSSSMSLHTTGEGERSTGLGDQEMIFWKTVRQDDDYPPMTFT